MSRHKRFEALKGRLYAYALNLTGDREWAADLVHDCAVRAFSAFSLPAEPRAHRAWLFRTLRNLHLDQLRRRRLAPVPLEDPEPEPAQPWPASEEAVIRRLSLERALADLSLAHREIILLVDLIGLSYAEAAEILDIPPGTVMSRLSRARAQAIRLMVDPKVVALERSRRRASS